MPTPPSATTLMSPPDIVLAPRTPTPPQSPTPFDTGTPINSNSDSENPSHGRQRQGSYGLGLTSHSSLRHHSSQSSITYDSGSLSPVRMDRQGIYVEEGGNSPSNNNARESQAGPFNFQTTTMAKSPVIKSVCHLKSRLYHAHANTQ